MKERSYRRLTNSITSPPSPHPKHLNRSGTPPTDIDAVESSWNGQHPM
jgi:hypothetical protein